MHIDDNGRKENECLKLDVMNKYQQQEENNAIIGGTSVLLFTATDNSLVILLELYSQRPWHGLPDIWWAGPVNGGTAFMYHLNEHCEEQQNQLVLVRPPHHTINVLARSPIRTGDDQRRSQDQSTRLFAMWTTSGALASCVYLLEVCDILICYTLSIKWRYIFLRGFLCVYLSLSQLSTLIS